MRIVFFDLETAGLEPHHPIIQIAAVAVDPALNELASFEQKLAFDPAGAEPDALALNHYDPAAWAREAVSPMTACQNFASFLKRFADVPAVSRKTGRPYYIAQLAGHAAATFDAPRLQALFSQHSTFLPGTYLPFDTLQCAAWFFLEHPNLPKPDNLKLPTLAAYFNIPTEINHSALDDVRTTIAVYKHLALTPDYIPTNPNKTYS